MATQNPYSDSLLMDAFRGSLSNAESLGRGFAVAPVGLLGDVNALARQYITPRLPQSVQGLLQAAPAAPTTEQILSNIPRASAPRMETSGMEQLGAAMNPRGPVELAKAVKNMPVGLSIKPVDDMAGLLSYRGSHKAPSPEFGAPLHDLTGGGQMYPADVYSPKAAQYYGTGYPKADKEAFALANKVRGNPDAEVTMYRAVPKDASIANINAGDWVTLSKDYAKNHGESVLGNDYKILSQKVKAKDLWTNADSIHEFGYQPQDVTKPSFTYPQEEAMRLAQQRAALPKEQFGLGLPPNNTAQQRAEAMFPVDVYHGSISPDILKFDTSLSGSKSGNPFDDYVFSTTSPENASGYALNWGSYKKEVESLPEFKALNEQISDSARKIADAFEQKDFAKADELEQIIKQANAKKMDFYNDFMSGKYVSEGATVYPLVARSSEFMPYEAGGKNWMRVNRPAIEASQEAGFSGVNIKNVKDNAGKGLDVVADTYATNRPEDLFRSRNAAFDPFRRTTAIAALMGVAAPDLLAQEQQPYQGLLGR